MIAAVAVPLLVVLLVLVNVRDEESDDDPIQVEGPATTARADLPPLDVEVPPVTPEADAYCPAFMTDLPVELAGERARPVRSDTPYAYAWGEPAIVVRCGVDRPAGFLLQGPATIQPLQLNQVAWFIDDSDPDEYVYTAVDRPVYVEVTVPSTIDSEPVVTLSGLIAATMPAQEPQPG